MSRAGRRLLLGLLAPVALGAALRPWADGGPGDGGAGAAPARPSPDLHADGGAPPWSRASALADLAATPATTAALAPADPAPEAGAAECLEQRDASPPPGRFAAAALLADASDEPGAEEDARND